VDHLFDILLEPGYYKEGEYGIRIESILRVVPARFEVLRQSAASLLIVSLDYLFLHLSGLSDGIFRSILQI